MRNPEEAQGVDGSTDDEQLKPARSAAERRDRQSANQTADATDAVHDAESLGTRVQLRFCQYRQERHVRYAEKRERSARDHDAAYQRVAPNLANPGEQIAQARAACRPRQPP